MQELPLHPALVHVPLGIAVLLPLLAGALCVALWREILPKRSWLIVLMVAAVGLVSALAARSTGETEEQRVEEWVARRSIHQHEEAADSFTIALALTTLATAGAFVIKRPRLFKAATLIITIAYLVVLGLALRVGHLGGELVFRHNAGSGRAPSQ